MSPAEPPLDPIPSAVVTVSDRCHAGTQEDRSGPLARELLLGAGLVVGEVIVVPDETEMIRGAVRGAIDAGARLVLTTGGTGVGPRDGTPEAVAPLLVLQLPGLPEAARARGRAVTPFADVSRAVAGLTGRGPGAVLLVTAPGSTGGVRDTVAAVAPLAEHILDQAAGSPH